MQIFIKWSLRANDERFACCEVFEETDGYLACVLLTNRVYYWPSRNESEDGLVLNITVLGLAPSCFNSVSSCCTMFPVNSI